MNEGEEPSKPHSLAAVYGERVERFRAEAAEAGKSSGKLANGRLVVFLLILLPLILGVWLLGDSPAALLGCYGVAGLALVGFLVLVAKHAAVDAQVQRLRGLEKCNLHAIARRERDWDSLPVGEPGGGEEDSGLSRDIDLFGRASLFQFLGTATSPSGRGELARSLLEGVGPELRSARRGAIEELSADLDLRQNVEVAGAGLLELKRAEDPFAAEQSVSGKTIPSLVSGVLSFVLPIALILAVAAALLGWIPHLVWALILAVNVFLGWLYRKQLCALLDPLGKSEEVFLNYSRLFKTIQDGEFSDAHLISIAKEIAGATEAIDQLEDLSTRAAARGSIPHVILQNGFLWDFRTAAKVESWNAAHRSETDAWFRALGEFETVSAIAQLRADEPDWRFAEFHETPEIKAEGLGHPLLAGDVRVCNDVRLGPAGSFLLVTGSNMSGKSTLLRSLGLNALLAQAGAPVCATSFALCPVQLATSIKVEDSLDEGKSFFRAELERIRDIVDQAIAVEAGDKADARVVLFLLDEILRGTNSEERREIVSRVVARLCDAGAIGSVTTHDLALAEVDSLRQRCQLVHFREYFDEGPDGPEMRFDYLVREGISPTTNAVKMMRMVGLDL